MDGARKILRLLAAAALLALSLFLFIEAAVNGPRESQLLVASTLMLGALGLIATWFWSPLG